MSKQFRSYPVKTLYIHYSKYYSMISSAGTDESSEWHVNLSGSSLLTCSLHFAVKRVRCPLWLGLTMHDICNIPVFTFV